MVQFKYGPELPLDAPVPELVPPELVAPDEVLPLPLEDVTPDPEPPELAVPDDEPSSPEAPEDA